ncbi:rubrerythrin-like domain-containing protein [Natronolimnohabitans sp. A-GB9]|uniref:rubrerythrin-like domain-containing protein n=1 Tax=Natronolimnohabitans sp. A-GB9 TaxID=3069757 RepID=UPI0027B08806|nr:rubrerythrin-like domain-containing protein [Natronolimnohabitans sp. A-GB9]MDQ2050400.1 rubrerythrin-like domain-containing protein [Natronolimnohabitans sp. A-GB9]
MASSDTHRSEKLQFECRDCPYITTKRSHPPICPRCGGKMRNRGDSSRLET